jgi:hypothetical protein
MVFCIEVTTFVIGYFVKYVFIINFIFTILWCNPYSVFILKIQ